MGGHKRKKRRHNTSSSNHQPSTNNEDPPTNKKPPSEERTALQVPESSNMKRFVTQADGALYQQTLTRHYPNLALVPHNALPNHFHKTTRRYLHKLLPYYHYDMVQAGGSVVTRTFVKRTLVGEPGITYKYLGLRLFAHAWTGPNSPAVFQNIHKLNAFMIEQTRLQQEQHNDTSGSCQYNLTLINYMEPSDKVPLREEEDYQMGKTSVSWHADSSLQENSCIGVYHTVDPASASGSWKIAVRPNPDNQSTSSHAIPPAVVPTQSGDVYFLLNDFNEMNQHMVLAGRSSLRISSTHRVAQVTSDTYAYIRDRVSSALVHIKKELGQPHQWNRTVILESQQCLTELEFEWIAQYWIQGSGHNTLHVWWQAPMRELERAWGALEKMTFKIYKRVIDQPEPELVQELIGQFQLRMEKRNQWDERRSNKVYQRRMGKEFQPVARPVFEKSSKRLPKDLTLVIEKLSKLLPSDTPNAVASGPKKKQK